VAEAGDRRASSGDDADALLRHRCRGGAAGGRGPSVDASDPRPGRAGRDRQEGSGRVFEIPGRPGRDPDSGGLPGPELPLRRALADPLASNPVSPAPKGRKPPPLWGGANGYLRTPPMTAPIDPRRAWAP